MNRPVSERHIQVSRQPEDFPWLGLPSKSATSIPVPDGNRAGSEQSKESWLVYAFCKFNVESCQTPSNLSLVSLKTYLSDTQPNKAGRPSVCRNCGALIGAGETSCLVCGAALAPETPRHLPLRERYNLNYVRAVLSRPYMFTIVFLVLNFFVFLLMWQASGMSTFVLWAAFPESILLWFWRQDELPDRIQA